MKARFAILNIVVAAFVAIFAIGQPARAQTAALDSLFERLKTASAEEAEDIEAEIWIEWSKSGSDAMDLLLERGRSAMASGDASLAVQHLSALVDHAPDFAEGWNARATAFYQLGQFGPSIADIAQTLTLNPRHFGALSGLGAIFESLGAPEKALEAYKAALAINPFASGVEDAIDRLSKTTQGIEL